MKRRQFYSLLIAAALTLPFSAVAQNSTSVDDYTIHHNAFTTDTLTPEVAKAYGLQRSKHRGMLNVSVIKEKAGTTGTSVPARVEVQAVALTGQASRIPMRELKDQDAVYYVGEFAVHNEETVNFAIEVTPEGTDKSYKMRMDQQFFTD
jgi:hypothetical protein